MIKFLVKLGCILVIGYVLFTILMVILGWQFGTYIGSHIT